MHKIVDVSMEKNILEQNQKIADKNSELFKKYGVRAFNVLGAIGSGKTTIIEKLAEGMKEENVGAVAGDVSGQDDYLRFIGKDMPSVAVNTGKDCHLDAHYVSHALEDFDLEELDYLFIENVGNLICPVDFPLGTEANIVVISVTEGDDMIRKHPLIFAQSDISIINKVDLADVMEVDLNVIYNDFRKINPHGELIKMDAREGKGVEKLAELLDLPYSLPL